jgi:hypothetical protein
MKTFTHEGITYEISSFSGSGHNCVGVNIAAESIRIINTNHPNRQATFTEEEWNAFIAGAKAGEFDLK